MTAQIPDTLVLYNQQFSIAGVNGGGLFDPYALGLRPVSRITSCWRGYVCEYEIVQNKLVLNQLRINPGADQWDEKTGRFLSEESPAINGVKPQAGDPRGLFSNIYQDLNRPVDFSGGILAGREFIQELYVHMGFHPAWKYQTVFEIVVSHGDVLEASDVSAQMQELRRKMVQAPLEPGTQATKKEIEEWVARTFKLDYNF